MNFLKPKFCKPYSAIDKYVGLKTSSFLLQVDTIQNFLDWKKKKTGLHTRTHKHTCNKKGEQNLKKKFSAKQTKVQKQFCQNITFVSIIQLS